MKEYAQKLIKSYSCVYQRVRSVAHQKYSVRNALLRIIFGAQRLTWKIVVRKALDGLRRCAPNIFGAQRYVPD